MTLNFVYEGLEGAGKTLQTILLAEVLRDTADFPVMAVNEPGGTRVGSIIRHSLLLGDEGKEMHPRTRMLLYSADRNELIEQRIIPFNNMHPDGITIGDRTWPSTLSLQTADGAEVDYTQAVQEIFIPKYPTKIFLLDIHQEEAMVRLYAAKKLGREINWRDKMPVETYAVHRKNYLDLAKRYPDKFILIDGFQTPWQITYETRNIVLSEMSKQPELKDRATRSLEEFSGANFGNVIEKFRHRGDGRVFEEEGVLESIESARIELGASSKEVLREKMHEDWRSMGLEGFISGIERGK